ncbi:alpha amylase, catalytic domain-containing protein [Trichoderma breve]|uniref:Alpha amylase, catalytic domain-containing protein n=1 Tax=Trichoderma breve TaxID=2034170 RepID=A0A9W9ECP6_9HYPO|nr:alpha amylase, catalytic domain-containing protein [Trichoderma breve]KAJ4864187.1 alpha amylase, catalytic domain-containing protein [Trichoderma breve]
MGSTEQLRTWWKESSVYQVYPASFQDTTGSGTGDLKGIISRVDYLKDLGVDIVWLSPIFASPQKDMGYDISDYRKIDPIYGDISDVDTLKDKLHERGMKLVLDLVVNHTSDQHEWFKESRKSKDNAFRDWYIWRPPNAWEYDETTDEYYLRLFCREQPDLNWENPDVRKAVHEVMRFWLGRGIDGFRMDVINFISKDQRFPDSDKVVCRGHEYYACGPRLHEYLKDLGAILIEYDAFNVGEMPCVQDQNEIIKAVGADRGELNMIFHFEHMDLDYGPTGKFSPGTWTLAKLKTVVTKWQEFMYNNNGWNALYLENHDQPRVISRFAHDDPQHREASAKMIAVFHAFQAGTPFIYQGQEIGMTNVPKEWPIEEYKDIDCVNHWNLYKDTADEETKKLVKAEYQKKSRDNARTPMQWDATPQAGFTSSTTPWMRVNDNYKDVNAASQTGNPQSVYHTYRQVLQLRKKYMDIFIYGSFQLVYKANERVFAYRRRSATEMALVMCNFSLDEVVVGSADVPIEVLFSTHGRTMDDFKGEQLSLAPCEAVVLLVEPTL